MTVTLHDKSVLADSSVVHLRGEENGTTVKIELGGRAVLADAFESGKSYELTLAPKP